MFYLDKKDKKGQERNEDDTHTWIYYAAWKLSLCTNCSTDGMSESISKQRRSKIDRRYCEG